MNANVPFPETKASLVTSFRALLKDMPAPFWADETIDSSVWDAALLDPAHDILGRTGKGLRAHLLERAWRLAGGEPGGVPAVLPLAIELLHAGSLVIDDIEDDSTSRRGQPAIHRRYGLPLALNMGNWLYFLALTLFSRVPGPQELRGALFEDASLALLRCHQGQALDLSVRVTSTRRSEIPGLVACATRLKTGSLMELAAILGARAAGASPRELRAIGDFGTRLGVGLQMLDDWSGVNVAERREKGIEDVKLARPTWPWAWLAEGGDEVAYAAAIRRVRNLSVDWQAELVLDGMRTLLHPMAPERIGAQLDSALEALRQGVSNAREVDEIHEYVVGIRRAFS